MYLHIQIVVHPPAHLRVGHSLLQRNLLFTDALLLDSVINNSLLFLE